MFMESWILLVPCKANVKHFYIEANIVDPDRAPRL